MRFSKNINKTYSDSQKDTGSGGLWTHWQHLAGDKWSFSGWTSPEGSLRWVDECRSEARQAGLFLLRLSEHLCCVSIPSLHSHFVLLEKGNGLESQWRACKFQLKLFVALKIAWGKSKTSWKVKLINSCNCKPLF